MSSHMPPIPPEQRSNKGPGADSPGNTQADLQSLPKKAVPNNTAQQDRHGNSKINTTHQGYQQDR